MRCLAHSQGTAGLGLSCSSPPYTSAQTVFHRPPCTKLLAEQSVHLIISPHLASTAAGRHCEGPRGTGRETEAQRGDIDQEQHSPVPQFFPLRLPPSSSPHFSHSAPSRLSSHTDSLQSSAWGLRMHCDLCLCHLRERPLRPCYTSVTQASLYEDLCRRLQLLPHHLMIPISAGWKTLCWLQQRLGFKFRPDQLPGSSPPAPFFLYCF